jgi:hypothetical protein
MAMETRRWVNQSQPQTMVIAVFLLYFTAVLALLFGINDTGTAYFLVRLAHLGSLGFLLRLITAVAYGIAGFGIANERRPAYYLGIGAAAVPLIGDLALCIQYQVSPLRLDLLTLIFQVALFALLIHPQSREYQRIWFK